jgi:hypothetical protein
MKNTRGGMIVFCITGILLYCIVLLVFKRFSQNCEKRLLATSCMSVRPFAWNNLASAGRLLITFHI